MENSTFQHPKLHFYLFYGPPQYFHAKYLLGCFHVFFAQFAAGSRSRKESKVFWVESDSWQPWESEWDFFVRLRMSDWIIFYITLLNWEFLLKWYTLFWNFCWNRDYPLCTTAFIDFNFIASMLRSRKFRKGRSCTFYLRLRNPGSQKRYSAPAADSCLASHANSISHSSSNLLQLSNAVYQPLDATGCLKAHT